MDTSKVSVREKLWLSGAWSLTCQTRSMSEPASQLRTG
jgi:hypothetical protein